MLKFRDDFIEINNQKEARILKEFLFFYNRDYLLHVIDINEALCGFILYTNETNHLVKLNNLTELEKLFQVYLKSKKIKSKIIFDFLLNQDLI